MYLQCILVSAAAAYVSLIKPPRSGLPTPSTLPVSCALSHSPASLVLPLLSLSFTLPPLCSRSLSLSLSRSLHFALADSLPVTLSLSPRNVLFSLVLAPFFSLTVPFSFYFALCLSLFLSFLLSRPSLLFPLVFPVIWPLLPASFFLLRFTLALLSRRPRLLAAYTRRSTNTFERLAPLPPTFRRLLSIGR